VNKESEIEKITKKTTNYKEISKILIPDTILKKELTTLISRVHEEAEAIDNRFERNVIDPFAYIIESAIFNKKKHKDWKLSELSRQVQKTFTNALGEFHQNLLCSLEDCVRPEAGADLINNKKKIVAEIKNKHNSINEGSKTAAFDKIKNELEKKNRNGYKGYFVTVIPKNPKNYEKIFTTTKNKNSSAFRVADKRIISINAELFYEKITDKKDMLKSIYQRIPEIFLSIDKKKYNNIADIEKEKYFNYYLLKAFKKSK
jgi:hypothetical protein